MKKRPKAGQHWTWELSAEAVLIPLLRPGEPLRIALSGITGWFHGLSVLEVVLEILGALGSGNAPLIDRTTYIGITDEELVFVIAKGSHKPSSLQRVPLGNVSIVKFKESRTLWLIDVLVIQAGRKRLTLSTVYSLRPVIRELAATLDRRRQEAGITDSAGHLQDTLAPQAPSLPLHVRLFHPIASASRDVADRLRVDGPARASIRASRYAFNLFAAFIAGAFGLVIGLMALALIFPNGLPQPLLDVVLFILILPMLLAILLSVPAALVAAGLAIYSIFKRGERPLTVIAALLRTAALIVCYALAAFGAVVLGGE